LGALRRVPPSTGRNRRTRSMSVITRMPKNKTEITVAGRKLAVSNLQKVLYPSTGFTKGQVIDYYIAIGPVLLPHLHKRALTLKRYPDGVGKFFFYEKSCPPYRPSWVNTASIMSKTRGAPIDYCQANNLPSLVWMANLADLELHVSLARSSAPNRPTAMVFDLDPGPGTSIVECSQVAMWLRERFAEKKLQAFAKTSGSKGMQLYVPLNTPVTFEKTRAASHQIALELEEEHPESVVTNMRKELRKGKVLIDWSQNASFKTTVCVYSLRGTEKPGVSTPLEWSEVEKFWKKKDPELARFTPEQVLARVEKHGDLFEPVLTLKQKLWRIDA
jgi:bifunctional non-homologous end joining protein LigD